MGWEALWDVRGAWSVVSYANYSWYHTEGDQDQYFYDGENAGVRLLVDDLTVEGQLFTLGAMLRYTF